MKNNLRIVQDRAGFTFIELLVVFVIIAVLAAAAIPSFAVWMPNYRVKKAARDLYSDMQLAKLGSIKENVSWRVVYNSAVVPGTYTVWSHGPNNNWDGGAVDDVSRSLATLYHDLLAGDSTAVDGVGHSEAGTANLDGRALVHRLHGDVELCDELGDLMDGHEHGVVLPCDVYHVTHVVPVAVGDGNDVAGHVLPLLWRHGVARQEGVYDDAIGVLDLECAVSEPSDVQGDASLLGGTHCGPPFKTVSVPFSAMEKARIPAVNTHQTYFDPRRSLISL